MNYIRRSGKFESEEDPFGKSAQGVAFLNAWSIVIGDIFCRENLKLKARI